MILSFYYLQIAKIENLAHLTVLRVLHLAGNEIVNVCKVSGMKPLAELNLRRNKISSVVRMYFFKFLICRNRVGEGATAEGTKKLRVFSLRFSLVCLFFFFFLSQT